MLNSKNIFYNKKILIYGMGKSGFSSFLFLKKTNDIYLYDDFNKKIKDKKFNKFLINFKEIKKLNFDFIVISPGIDIKKCKLKNVLKKNSKKIVTDLDIFFTKYYKNKNITITGTNGKSTTAKILYEILKNAKKDVRLTGNIGRPILLEKNVNSKTIFVIEASSYQLDYSRFFKADYGVILNITPDHLERHGTFLNYIKSKFKLIKNQTNRDYSFLNLSSKYLKNKINKNQIKSKVINVTPKLFNKKISKIKNPYFISEGNRENLSFIFAIIKKFGIEEKKLYEVVEKYKGLKYRQEIVFNSKKITLINDSKATSYSSTINILKVLKKTYWILGGIPKKGDKFFLKKVQCTNYKAYIFGNYRNYFKKELNKKMNCQVFKNLKSAILKIILDIKMESITSHKTILFSPSAASFDEYKNFEDRGAKFNILIKDLNLIK